MSAFICQPEHIGLIAAWSVQNRCALRELEKGEPITTALNIARDLAQENINSVAHRYPNDKDGERPGPSGLTDAKIIEASQLWAAHYLQKGFPEGLALLTIAKLADSLEYQSCEHDEFKTSLAQCQINEVRSRVISLLPGYDRAPWAWDDNSAPELDALIYEEDLRCS